MPGSAFAQDAAPAAPSNGAAATEEPTPPKVARILLSKKAAEKLSEQRVRRLIELQVPENVLVPEDGAGPLDEHAVRVFIDLPEPALVVIQVQAPDRRIETRNVDVGGLPWEVATRFVALAASQSVRAQLAPPRKPKPRPPTPDEIAKGLAAKPSLSLDGGIEAAYASHLETGFLGSRLRLSFHQAPLSESISIAALGSFDGGLWVDIDMSAFHRFWVGPNFRFGAGLGFALAVTDHLHGLAQDDSSELWVRPHAVGMIDLRMSPATWLAFAIEPGAAVDPRHEEAGLWFGGSIRLGYEGL